MVEMTVQRVGIDPRRNAVLILADAEGHRLLPIYIGFYEAQSIAMAISGEDIGRPLTHDLLLSVVDALGGRLEEIHITRLVERTFYAILRITVVGEMVEIDSRPSDAVALAVRTGARIMVAEEVLEVAQVIEADAEQEEQEKEKFRDLLEQIQFDDEPPDTEQ
ncbi:MAG: bifunctional nuclease family protein [Armatimonadetes bacterium]|nr:bifunctional nuclease family protein [Armatimonadota bacterium]